MGGMETQRFFSVHPMKQNESVRAGRDGNYRMYKREYKGG